MQTEADCLSPEAQKLVRQTGGERGREGGRAAVLPRAPWLPQPQNPSGAGAGEAPVLVQLFLGCSAFSQFPSCWCVFALNMPKKQKNNKRSWFVFFFQPSRDCACSPTGILQSPACREVPGHLSSCSAPLCCEVASYRFLPQLPVPLPEFKHNDCGCLEKVLCFFYIFFFL